MICAIEGQPANNRRDVGDQVVRVDAQLIGKQELYYQVFVRGRRAMLRAIRRFTYIPGHTAAS